MILVIDAISDFRVVAPLLHPRVTAMFGHEDGRSYPEVKIERLHCALSFSVARAVAGEGDANGDRTLSQDELIDLRKKKVEEITGGKLKPGVEAGTPATGFDPAEVTADGTLLARSAVVTVLHDYRFQPS